MGGSLEIFGRRSSIRQHRRRVVATTVCSRSTQRGCASVPTPSLSRTASSHRLIHVPNGTMDAAVFKNLQAGARFDKKKHGAAMSLFENGRTYQALTRVNTLLCVPACARVRVETLWAVCPWKCGSGLRAPLIPVAVVRTCPQVVARPGA